MRILLLAIGRMKAGPERELLARYVERARAMARQVGVTGFELRELDESRARHADERKREEGAAMRRECPAASRLVVFDARGTSFTSEVFAKRIAAWRDQDGADLALVIGGPDGVDPSLRSEADLALAFGAATFPHQIVRILAAEQVYRAMTILAGHPYHRA